MHRPTNTFRAERRRLLASSGAALLAKAGMAPLVQGGAVALLALACRPALADTADEALAAAVRQWAAGRSVQEGRVVFDIAPLVENGHVVPVTVRVPSAMAGADRVEEIALFNARNPQREVARFQLGPLAGRAEVATRIRLATSQQAVALARFADGSLWSHHVEVVVTLAACVEE